MSNMQNHELNAPSTSQISLESLPSSDNQPKENKTATSKKSAKQTGQKIEKSGNNSLQQDISNSSVQDITKQCQDLTVNSDSDEAENTVNKTPKKKNARKKEKLKQLQTTPKSNSIPTQAPQYVNYSGNETSTAVHNMFLNQIGQMYANSSSRYLENLCHHPQYQAICQNLIASNAANMMQVPVSPGARSNPSTPHLQSEPSTPRFFQNVMQHPLLSKSFSMDTQENFKFNFPVSRHNNAQNSPKENNKQSPRHRNRNKKADQNGEKKFEQYISTEQVELGLKNETLLEGVMRINPKQFQHGYVSSNDRSEQDILIDGIRNRNRALEGDVVVVQYLDSDSDGEDKQKKGKVVYIKERVHNRTCIGNLKLMPDKNRQKALFVPRDSRIPRLNIPFTCWPDNFYDFADRYENTLFLAKICEWYDTRFATGRIMHNIGQAGDMVTESKAILAQNDLDVTPFGPEVRHLFPRLDYVIPEEEIKLREDCRKMCIFSIDPSNCRDIDDAVSCVELPNGNYEVGVHISDVAHYLTENTLLDEKVSQKATTIYMVERAYHMLPDELCMLCSLFPGVDKLAFSVFWEMTKDAEVVSKRFAKTVIQSCAQLSYDHAQAILDNNEKSEEMFPETYNGYKYADIYKTVKMLGRLSSIMRTKRFNDGALRIDQVKVSFRLSTSNGLPESFWIYESKESHQLIEEFMLLANMTVAERIYDDYQKLAFLRCHPPPSTYMLKQLAKSLKPMGIDLNISTAGDLHKSLLPYIGPDSTDRGKGMVLSLLCAKPMARAKYFCAHGTDDDDFHHYALNVPLYTHFTSPIRRYADIMVHRLLAGSLKYREPPNWEVDKVRMIAAQCNKQKYNAKKASEMSTELYTLKYIEMNSPLVTEAVVVDVKEKYVDIIVASMGLNRRVFLNNDFPGECKCIKSTAGARLDKMEVTWHATRDLPQVKQVIEIFTILKVELHKGDDMVKVETKLIRPA